MLDLTGAARSVDPRHPQPGKRHVNFLDGDGNIIGTMVFNNIETVMSCFTTGTRIATPSGPRAIETLERGDLVMTRDHGPQAIRWIGRRTFSADLLAHDPTLQPILIRQGALGRACPSGT